MRHSAFQADDLDCASTPESSDCPKNIMVVGEPDADSEVDEPDDMSFESSDSEDHFPAICLLVLRILFMG